MPDHRPRRDRQTPRKEKLCKACGRAFSWTPQQARDWDVTLYCSQSCRNQHGTATEAELEAAILELLAERNSDGGHDKTICPSEAARLVGGRARRGAERQPATAWQALMEPARAAARRLVAQGRIVLTQHGQPVDPAAARGPIRLRLR
ncbi:MAG: DUF3253 domain-containing protein [Acidobacteriota bacterium]|nr:DUF3253 domain-containing protein [Acidobacteriota bacterium]